MQFIDLQRQKKRIENQISSKITQVLNHGKFILGPEVTELEQKLASYCQRRYALGVANGTDALVLALRALGIKNNDIVIVPAFTFFATAEAISSIGAIPMFVDIGEDYNIDTETLRANIKNIYPRKPKAIIAVDLFGKLANYQQLSEFAKEEKIFLIEDAAQSMGATSFCGKKSCSFGDISTTSFFPAKPLGCYGDGGMVFTDDLDLYNKMISLRFHGKGESKYENIEIGMNSRLDTIQAAILLEKLSILEEEIEQRQFIAQYYIENIKGNYKLPHINSKEKSAWAQFTIAHPERDKIMQSLKSQKIPTMIYYPSPLPSLAVYQKYECLKMSFKRSIKASQEVFSIPMHPYLSQQEQDAIIKALNIASKNFD